MKVLILIFLELLPSVSTAQAPLTDSQIQQVIAAISGSAAISFSPVTRKVSCFAASATRPGCIPSVDYLAFKAAATAVYDPPLVRTVDAAGVVHIGLTEWAGFGNCVIDSANKYFCTSLNAGFTPIPETMRNDVAVPIADVPIGYSGAWRLTHIILNKSITCFRAGMRQTPEVDFFQGGDSILSKVWKADDAIACDYEWLPAAQPIHILPADTAKP